MAGLVPAISLRDDVLYRDHRVSPPCGGPVMTKANAPPPVSREGAGCPVPFPRPPKREMERREAPGRCATAPLGPPLAIGTGKRALQGGIASPVPRRARAVIWRLARPRHRTAAPLG